MLKASNCCDCGRSSVVEPVVAQSVTEIEDPLHGALIGLEGIAVARDRVGHSLQNIERGTYVFMPVKWNKTARQQFGDCLAPGKTGYRIPQSMLQNEDSRQRRTRRRRKRGLAVPGRSVHEHLSRVLAHNDPVVAQNLNALLRSP